MHELFATIPNDMFALMVGLPLVMAAAAITLGWKARQAALRRRAEGGRHAAPGRRRAGGRHHRGRRADRFRPAHAVGPAGLTIRAGGRRMTEAGMALSDNEGFTLPC